MGIKNFIIKKFAFLYRLEGSTSKETKLSIEVSKEEERKKEKALRTDKKEKLLNSEISKKEELNSKSQKKDNKTPKENIKNGSISIDNALINAVQNLLLSEKRIISIAIMKLNESSAEKSPIFKIHAHEYATIFKIEKNTAYEQIKASADTLLKKQVHWYKKTEKGLHKVKTNWLSFAEYAPKEGFVEICFTDEIYSKLTHLIKNFTVYQLEQTTALRSIYSWRLLELLSQFKNTGWREIELGVFIKTIGASSGTDSLPPYSYVKRKVIEPAVFELNQKTDYEIEWQPIKKGKKVHSLLFLFSLKKIQKQNK